MTQKKTPPAPPTRQTCMTPSCPNKRNKHSRGLCNACYATFKKLRREGTLTEAEAVETGLVGPRTPRWAKANHWLLRYQALAEAIIARRAAVAKTAPGVLAKNTTSETLKPGDVMEILRPDGSHGFATATELIAPGNEGRFLVQEPPATKLP